MAGKSRSRQRVEPSFESGSRRADDDLRLDAEDRVAGGGKPGRSPRGKPASGGRGGKGGKSRKARRARGPLGIFAAIRRLIYWCIVLSIWGTMGIAGLVIYYGARMPSAETWTIPERPPNVKITGVDGSTIANRGITGGEELSLQEMSPYIPQAVVAIEDRRFYSHFGFDPIGFARAMTRNLLAGHMVQGGSTLTQQLAKNLFPLAGPHAGAQGAGSAARHLARAQIFQGRNPDHVSEPGVLRFERVRGRGRLAALFQQVGP